MKLGTITLAAAKKLSPNFVKMELATDWSEKWKYSDAFHTGDETKVKTWKKGQFALVNKAGYGEKPAFKIVQISSIKFRQPL